MLSSYLLQVPPHKNLEVQNSEGTWVSCPPIEGTFVVAMGQGLEAITGGVVASTTHRVLSPSAGEGPRYSIPFFQGVSYDTRFESMEVPEEVRKLKKQVVGNDVEMTFRSDMFERLGDATLTNRVKVFKPCVTLVSVRLIESIVAYRCRREILSGYPRESQESRGICLPRRSRRRPIFREADRSQACSLDRHRQSRRAPQLW
jgi:hypothetical protein